MNSCKLLLSLALLFLASPQWLKAQEITSRSESRRYCFQRSTERIGQRFVDWECGKDGRTIDCNERLELDPGSNLIVLGSSGRPFSGRCETCHDNGLLERRVEFLNGKSHGTDTTYYPSGCPQVIRTHVEGAENGVWTFYNDSSGLIAWQIGYFNGLKHGQSIYYRHFQTGTDHLTMQIGNAERKVRFGLYDSDTLRIENFNMGRLHGPRLDYFPGSKLRREVHYQNGLMHGPFIVYNEEGMVLQENNFNQGKKDGEWKFYYENGALLKIENWSNDIPNGVFKWFFINGNIQKVEEFDRRGRKNGWFEERFPDDKVKRRTLYRRGEIVEDHEFDQYGNEIRTVGDAINASKQDDELPTTTKSKKWWQFWKK
ncbi:MAG: toxin-antitoxin system YwqK family antitoxin [Crocinitomicaceae bacterium]|nr:toxin-antitoxin system YwqK family antitoxin [Crocinitomicaceae bacterium]